MTANFVCDNWYIMDYMNANMRRETYNKFAAYMYSIYVELLDNSGVIIHEKKTSAKKTEQVPRKQNMKMEEK